MSAVPESPRVLLVDDDDTFRRVMSSELGRRGLEVIAVADGQAALDRATDEEQDEIDVILLDLHLPDIDGIDVLQKLREREVGAGVVVLTGHGTIDTAIQAIRLGASDYLEKPCPIEKVEMTIQKIHEHGRLVRRQRVLEDGYAPPDVGHGIVGRSEAFRDLCRVVSRIAQTDSTTLIRGETGVGKEMVAILLHAQSPRKDAPFVVVDCTSLHEDLLQSELFGHEKGAFTGAARLKHGLFEVAHGGTLFLDEVGETTPEIQAKLLRVLETSRFRRVGGTKEIGTDVRILSATNRDLEKAIERGHFRRDLFFRLATLTIDIPPLRDRKDDIEALVDHFVARFNHRFGMKRRFGADAMRVLLRHPWPGNVRELSHVVEQVIVLADRDVLEPEDLPASVRVLADGGAAPVEAGEMPTLRELEKHHVLAVLEKVGGNRAQAARILDISERNLYRLLKKYDGGDGEPRSAPA